MADAAVSFLLSNVVDLVTEYGSLVRDAEKPEIYKLQDKLNWLMQQKDSFQGSRYFRRQLESDVTDVVYWFENLREAAIMNEEGLLPAHNYKFREKLKMMCSCGGFRASSTGVNFSWISYKIGLIQQKLENAQLSTQFNDPFPEEELDLGPRSNYNFVWREEETNLLVKHLCAGQDEIQGPRVISISGMGGVGKTALAKELFDHREVEYAYPARIWIPVSQKLDKGKILATIYRYFRSGKPDPDVLLDERSLMDKISYDLEMCWSLIVLDDVWSLDDWEILKGILSFNSVSKTKILMTTRIKQVARKAHATVHLDPLRDERGCELLAKNTESSVDKIPETLGKKIVNFCGGLPFTLVSFTQSIETTHTLEQLEEMVTIRVNSSLSKRLETREIQKSLNLLASSYDDLARSIQPLFLYMGVLQENLQVEVEKLYLLSLADQLLIALQREDRPVTVAQDYMIEVEQKCLVELEEAEEPAITRFKYCQLNELMRDLSLLKNREERFFKFVDFARESQPIVQGSFSASAYTACRAAINLDEYEEGYEFHLEDYEMMHMRVLLLRTKKRRVWPRDVSLVEFKYIRALDFNGFSFEPARLPGGIAKAVHLRYLSLKDCILEELPSWVGNLKLLEVLDLRVHHSTKMIIPNVLRKLSKLRHLFFPASFEVRYGGKLRIDGLKELETITNLNAEMVNVEDLLGLPKLQYLDAKEVTKHEDIDHIVKRLTKSDQDSNIVESLPDTLLEIRNFDCYTEERHASFRKLVACESLAGLFMEGHICRLPAHDKLSPNLTKIVFVGAELVEDPMRTLEKLFNLHVLVLNDAFVGENILCAKDKFKKLKVLKILNFRFLKEWIVEEGAMPNVFMIAITNCRRLKMLPEKLKNVRGLKKLEITWGKEPDLKGFPDMAVKHEFFQSLTKVLFVGSELKEDPMRILGKLPKLCELVLDNAFTGKEIVCSSSGFVELKVLKILNFRFLEKWIVEEGAMPKVSNIAIANCGRLEMLPEGLKFVRGLIELKISSVSQELQNRIQTGEDKCKVQHVPAIIFEE